jgi:iron complex outermembrane receptor protein
MRVTNLRLKLCIGSVLAAAAVSNSALAQEKISVLEEIVVTAQKRSESLQEVPVAISAFTDSTRDLIGISSVQDMTNFAPGITYSSSLDRMSVRGIGRNTNNLAIDPSIANYGDGFYNSSNHQADGTPLFVERVEILRGPQGTLYGRNSIGGAINVISKRPTEEFSGEFRAQYGSYDYYDMEGTISGPITDWLRFKVGGGSYNQNQGYIHNYGGEDELGVRKDTYFEGQVSANIGTAVDVWAKVTSADWDRGYGGAFGTSAGAYYTGVNPTNGSLNLIQSLGPNALYNSSPGYGAATPAWTTQNPRVSDPRAIDHNTPANEKLKDQMIAVLEVIGHMGFADLKYVGGYQQYFYDLHVDWDNSSRPNYTYQPFGAGPPVVIDSTVVGHYVEDKHYYSNELNLVSTTDSPLQYVFGLYQYSESFHQPFTIGASNQAQLAAPACVFSFTTSSCIAAAAANPDRNFYLTDQFTDIDSIAGYGQLDWKFADTWKATLGARYTKDKKTSDEYSRQVYWDPTAYGATPTLPSLDITSTATGGTRLADGRVTRHLEGEWDATTGTAGVEWNPQDGSLGYLKYTRGYKAGGINAGALVANPYTDPEYVNAYEVGWKQNIGERLQANISTFYYDYLGAQIPLVVPDIGTTRTDFYNLNMTILGIEVETIWSPIEDLQVMFNYSYLKTELNDPTGCYPDVAETPTNVGPKPCSVTIAGPPPTTIAGQKVDGNPAPQSPENKLALNLLYTFHFSPGSLSLSGSYLWRDEQYSAVFAREEYRVDAYGQADFRATWTDTDNNYSLVAYVRNAFDDLGYDGVGVANNGANTIVRTLSYTNPRTYGMQLQYRFGAAK